MKSNGPWPVPSLVPPFCFDRNNEEWTNFPNAKREKNQDPNVTKLARGRGALRGESWCHDAVRLPFPPTVPCRRPAPRAATGRVPRSPSLPLPVCPLAGLPRSPPAPAPCRPRAARSRRPPARDTPAARAAPSRAGSIAGREHRGPGASRAGSIPARRSPGRRRMKKPPAPWKGQGAGIDADGKPTRSPSRPALRFPSRSQTPPTA
jgi:hypothetical protein